MRKINPSNLVHDMGSIDFDPSRYGGFGAFQYYNFYKYPLGGASVLDESGNGSTATRQGSLTYSNKGWYFDGNVANYLSVGTPALQIGTGDFTVVIWYNFAYNVNTRHVFANDGLGGVGNFDLKISNPYTGGNLGSAWCRISNVDVTPFSGNLAFCDGTWHYVAISCDRDGLACLYNDAGILRTTKDISATSAVNIGLTDQRIGQRAGGNPSCTGWIGELGIFRKALTQQEVVGHYWSTLHTYYPELYF